MKLLAQRLGFDATFWRQAERAAMVTAGGDRPVAVACGTARIRADVVVRGHASAGYLALPGRHRNGPMSPLPRFAARHRAPQVTDVFTSRTRIVRLRDAWLRLPRLRRRNSCYVRAFTLYGFVDAGTR